MNWGRGLALTLVAFAFLMGFMVYKAFQQRFDLVSDNYYEQEIAFQEIIDKKENYNQLEAKGSLRIKNEQLVLELPNDLEGLKKGLRVHMYFLTDARKDFELEVSTIDNEIIVPETKLAKGKWIAKVLIDCQGKGYYLEPEIVL